jgi:hypothetical protein
MYISIILSITIHSGTSETTRSPHNILFLKIWEDIVHETKFLILSYYTFIKKGALFFSDTSHNYYKYLLSILKFNEIANGNNNENNNNENNNKENKDNENKKNKDNNPDLNPIKLYSNMKEDRFTIVKELKDRKKKELDNRNIYELDIQKSRHYKPGIYFSNPSTPISKTPSKNDTDKKDVE